MTQKVCANCRVSKDAEHDFDPGRAACKSCMSRSARGNTRSNRVSKRKNTENPYTNQAVLLGDGDTQCPRCSVTVQRRSLWSVGKDKHRCTE